MKFVRVTEGRLLPTNAVTLLDDLGRRVRSQLRCALWSMDLKREKIQSTFTKRKTLATEIVFSRTPARVGKSQYMYFNGI